MTEDTVENYDIVAILTNKSNSAKEFKVKSKVSGKLYLWHNIPFENYNVEEKQQLLTKIIERKLTEHPNLLKVYKTLEQKEGNDIHVMYEYLENGNLRNIIQDCIDNSKYITEELLCKILYQIIIICKTTQFLKNNISLDDIFLDNEYNIKLKNFHFETSQIMESKTCQLGFIMYSLCTLKKFDKNTFEKEVQDIKHLYSSNFISLILCLMKNTNDLKKNINKILCHPTILKKSSQWCKEKCFIRSSDNVEDKIETLRIKLKDKEISLNQREQIITEKEHLLLQREKKVAQMERTVKEKLQQAELYLKRCKNSQKSTTGSQSSLQSGSTASASSKTSSRTKLSYDNLDSTYVSISNDSVVLPTSQKLNVENIAKPKNFTKTMTEKKIRFKGHSPLKETNFNRKSSVRKSLGDMSRKMSRKSMLFSDTVYENEFQDKENLVENRVAWTEESKKYAFELLKMMNSSEKENMCVKGEVKHTYL